MIVLPRSRNAGEVKPKEYFICYSKAYAFYKSNW